MWLNKTKQIYNQVYGELIIMKENSKRQSALVIDMFSGSHVIKGLFDEPFDVYKRRLNI